MNMLKSFFIVLLLFAAGCAVADKRKDTEEPEKNGYSSVLDEVIAGYNSNDVKKIRSFFSENTAKALSEPVMLEHLKKMKDMSGRWKTVTKVRQLEKFVWEFVISGEKSPIVLTLAVVENKIHGIRYRAFDDSRDTFRDVAIEIFNRYNQGKYREINKFFNKNMNKVLPPEKTESFCRKIHGTCGEMVSILNGKKLSSETFSYPVFCENKKQKNLVISLDKDKKIQGFWIKDTLKPVKFPKITAKSTVEDIAKAVTDHKNTAGIVIGTYLNGKEKTYSFGYNSKKDKTPISKELLFEIGSITKTFTAAIAVQLENEGKLKLTDNIQQYLPEGVKMPKFSGDNTEITFNHILTHFSALPRMPENFGKYLKAEENPFANYPEQAIYDFLNDYKLTRKPGEKYEYSNLAMGLLGNILAKIDGKESYEELLQERIFKPLGMKNSTVERKKVDENNLAIPHADGVVTSYWDIPSLAGAGAVKSTLGDMQKYLKALIEDSHPELFSKKLFQVQKDVENDMSVCLSWFKIKKNNIEVLWHNGGTGGFLSEIIFDRENKAGVIILRNDNEFTDVAGNKIMQILLKKYDD